MRTERPRPQRQKPRHYKWFLRWFALRRERRASFPSSRDQGVTGLLEASFLVASSSHLPNCLVRPPGPPCPPLPPVLPPSQQSSRGWHQLREPQAALASVVRGSSPAQRNSRHYGWPCGLAWRARPGSDDVCQTHHKPPAPSPGSRP